MACILSFVTASLKSNHGNWRIMKQCRTLLTFYLGPAIATRRALADGYKDLAAPCPKPGETPGGTCSHQWGAPRHDRVRDGPTRSTRHGPPATSPGSSPPGTGLRAKQPCLICLSAVYFAARRRLSILTGYHSIAVTDICNLGAKLMSALILFLNVSKSHRSLEEKRRLHRSFERGTPSLEAFFV